MNTMLKKGIIKILTAINTVISIIIVIPFLIIAIIPVLIFTETTEKRFKFLKKKGYKHKREKEYSYYSKGKLTFRFHQDISYMVRINDEDYISIHDLDVGLKSNRDKLKNVLAEYQNAHPVDKQRGEINTLILFADFIKYYLSEIERIDAC